MRRLLKRLKFPFFRQMPQVASTGARIDKIAGLDHMLLLAQWIGGDGRVILEIDLNFLQGLTPFQRFGSATTIHLDPIVAPEDLPDRFGRAGHICPLRQPFRVPRQVVEQRFGSWHPLQMLWGVVA